MSVDNPWCELPEDGPYVLSVDAPMIEQFNANLRGAGDPCRLVTHDVLPEPFVGSVHAARALILLLNPGLDPTEDASAHADPRFRAALRANHVHRETRWPFYFLDPQFRTALPGGRWWSQRLGPLAGAVGWEVIAQRVAVVEWFPYKSTKYRPGCRVPSQDYSFKLVEAAMRRGAVIIVARACQQWTATVPGLADYEPVLRLSSAQNVTLSPNNMLLRGAKTPEAWKLVIDALRT